MTHNIIKKISLPKAKPSEWEVEEGVEEDCAVEDEAEEPPEEDCEVEDEAEEPPEEE